MGNSYSDFQYRCAGPNCNLVKSRNDRWWLMWTAWDGAASVLSLSLWNDELAAREGALPVCGELCAQKLQSQFMKNVLHSKMRQTS